MFIKKWVERIFNRTFQELINTDRNITSWRRGTATGYRGNEYNNYSSAVSEIDNKYNGTAEWGVVLTGNIIDVRAAFTVPAGINIVKKVEDNVDREMAFAKEFMNYNKFDDEVPFEFAKEEEIEGKLCVVRFWDEEYKWRLNNEDIEGIVKMRYLPWTTNKYTIHTNSDYMDFEYLTYNDPDTNIPKRIDGDDFVYRRFGGRIDRPNFPSMKTWKCLTNIENLDKALRDWREINRLFASPTPYFETEDQRKAKQLIDELNHMNWKIKDLLAAPAKFYFVQPDTAGMQTLKEEIITLAKIISGTTGVPVHFLGLPDLMSNRSTAENLMEFIWASTVKERETWNSAYTEILKKAIDLFNEKSGGKKLLRNDVLRLEIQEVSPEQWKNLEKVLLPAFRDGAISLNYLLSQIPGLILEEENKRREEEESEELEKTKMELERVSIENAELNKSPTNDKQLNRRNDGDNFNKR